MSRHGMQNQLRREVLEYVRSLHKDFVAKDIVEEFDEENPRKIIGALMQLRINGDIYCVGTDKSRGYVKIWRVK